VPVVLNKPGRSKRPSSTNDGETRSDVSLKRKEIPSGVFVGAIALFVLIVLFIAYRVFAPSDGGWDNSRQGAGVTQSALSGPPPVRPAGSGQQGKPGAPQDNAPQEPVGAELPPDHP
jgi:hypothetical protein